MQTMSVSFSDPSFALMSLELESSQVQKENANEDIEAAFDKLRALRAELQEARERAREAQRKSGFWSKCTGFLKGDVASLAGVVAAAAVIVGTGGSGAALVAACVASGLTASAKVGEKLGLPKELCTALAVSGAVLGLCTGNVGALSAGARSVAIGARCVQGGASAASGATGYARDRYSADALEAQADGKQIGLHKLDAEDRSSDGLTRLARISRNARRSTDLIISIQRGREESQLSILSRTGGV
jgi:hypothetical protein